MHLGSAQHNAGKRGAARAGGSGKAAHGALGRRPGTADGGAGGRQAGPACQAAGERGGGHVSMPQKFGRARGRGREESNAGRRG